MPLRALIRAYRTAYSGLPREVWLLALATLVNRAGTMVFPFLSLYLTRHLGFSPARAGQLLALYGVGAMIGSYAGGWLSDRVGAIRVQVGSLIATGVLFVAFTRLDTFTGVAVGITVVSIVGESFRPAMMAAVAEHCTPPVRARSFALIRLALNLGMAVGPAVGGLLAVHNYNWLFIGDAVTCWAAAVVLAVSMGPSHTSAEAPETVESRSGSSPWRDGQFLALMVLVSFLGLAFIQVFATMPLYLRDSYHVTERSVGALLALNTLLIVVFEMLLMRAVEHLNHLKVAAWGSLLVGAGLVLLPLGPPFVFAVLAMVVLTVGEMLALPMINALVAERAGAEGAGRHMGVYSLAFSTSLVIGPLSGTAVYEHLGGTVLWVGVGALGLVVWAGMYLLARFFHRR